MTNDFIKRDGEDHQRACRDTVEALAQLQLDHEQLISQLERDMTGGFTPMFLDAQGGFQWLDQVPSVA